LTHHLADAAAVAAAAIGMSTVVPKYNAHTSATAGAGTSGARSNSSQHATVASATHDSSDNADAVKTSPTTYTHKCSSYSNRDQRFDQHESSNSDVNKSAMDSSIEDRVSTPDEDCYDSDYKNRRIDSNSSATHRKAGERAAY
jgi:hypothetical protein